jgi:hypothetical protein
MKQFRGDFVNGNGVGSNYVKDDYGVNGMGFNVMDLLTGQTDISSVVTGLAYDQAMKLVEKNANIVKSFANNAVSAANKATAQVARIQAAFDPNEVEAAYAQAKSSASTAKNEASNAAKNYAVTITSLNALKKISGVPASVIDAANRIIAASKTSLDNANAAVPVAQNALTQVESIYNQKASTYLPSFIPASLVSDYGIYLAIGGVALVGIIGGLIYFKKSKTKAKE